MYIFCMFLRYEDGNEKSAASRLATFWFEGGIYFYFIYYCYFFWAISLEVVEQLL